MDIDLRLAAAISTALHLYLNEDCESGLSGGDNPGLCVHDDEPRVLTIRENASLWNLKSFTFRKLPDKRQ